MPLSDLISDCLALAYDTDYGAEAAVHEAAATGTDTACTVVRDESEGDEYRGGDTFGMPARIRVRTAEVTAVATADTITIGSEVYEVLWARKSADGTEWICECSLR
ncbi:MAG: hypothetical protein WC383_17140 [Gammaproteobacteria bacterium]|jgi:hypothetical protein